MLLTDAALELDQPTSRGRPAAGCAGCGLGWPWGGTAWAKYAHTAWYKHLRCGWHTLLIRPEAEIAETRFCYNVSAFGVRGQAGWQARPVATPTVRD